MLIVDNSVLSAFTYLDCLELLQGINSEIVTSKLVVAEYTQKWEQSELPKWIKILLPQSLISSENLPKTLSDADLSMLSLAIENDALLAAADKPLRKAAKRLKIRVIGTLGLLKLLYLKGHMDNKKTFLNLLEKLQTDLYLDEKLLKWAKKGI